MSEQNYWRRRMGRRRLLAGGSLAGGGLAAAVLVGCSSSNNNGNAKATIAATTTGTQARATAAATAPPSATAAVRATATAAAAAQPKRGGKLVFALTSGEQPNHDPHQTTSGALYVKGSAIVYSRLIRQKVGPDTPDFDFTVESEIAASWEQVDPTTFVFKLRPNAKWQNIAPVNGRTVTADDFVYSYNRQLSLKAAAGYLAGISRFTATDPATLRVEIDQANPDFPLSLADFHNVLVAKEAVDVKGDLKDGPVIGAGAWIFKELVPTSTIRFVRNPDYWMPGLPYADELEILRIGDHSTANAAFRTKQIMQLSAGAGDPTVAEADQLKKEISGLQVQPIPGSADTVILKTTSAPTTDVRVRQAVLKALNRQAMSDAITNGQGRITTSGLLQVTSADQLLPADEAKRLLAFDAAGAKQLLQAAGVQNWTPTISFYGQLAENQPITELIQAQLKDVGINGKLESLDINRINAYSTQHDRDFVVSFRRTQTGPHADLITWYKTGGPLNAPELSDPQLDQLITAQAQELKDKQKRNQILQDIQRRILDLAAAQPTFDLIRNTINAPQLRNTYRNPVTAPWTLDVTWLDT